MIVYHLICRLVRVSKQQRSTEIKQNTPHRLRKSAESRPRIPGKVSRNKKQLSFFVYCCTWHFVMSFQGVAAQGFSLEKMQNVVKTQDQALIISYANDKAENGSNLQLNAKRGVEMLEVDEQTGAENNKSNLTPEVDEQTGAENNKSNLTVEVDEQAGAENNKSNLTPEVDEQTGAENKSNLTPEVDEQTGAQHDTSLLNREHEQDPNKNDGGQKQGAERTSKTKEERVREYWKAVATIVETTERPIYQIANENGEIDTEAGIVIPLDSSADVHHIDRLLPNGMVLVSKKSIDDLKTTVKEMLEGVDKPTQQRSEENGVKQEPTQELKSSSKGLDAPKCVDCVKNYAEKCHDCLEKITGDAFTSDNPIDFRVVKLTDSHRQKMSDGVMSYVRAFQTLEKMRKELENDLEEIKQKTNQEQTEAKSLLRSLTDEYERENERMQQQQERLRFELKQLKENIKASEIQRATLTDHIESLKGDIDIQKQNLDLMVDLNSHPVTGDKVSGSNARLLSLSTQYCENVNLLKSIKEDLNKDVEFLRNEKAQLQIDAISLQNLTTGLPQLKQDVDAEQQALQSLTSQRQTVLQSVQEKQAVERNLQQSITNLENKISGLEEQNKDAEAKNNSLKRAEASSRNSLDLLQNKIKALESKKAQLDTRNAHVASAIDQKNAEITRLETTIASKKGESTFWEESAAQKQQEYDRTVLNMNSKENSIPYNRRKEEQNTSPPNPAKRTSTGQSEEPIVKKTKIDPSVSRTVKTESGSGSNQNTLPSNLNNQNRPSTSNDDDNAGEILENPNGYEGQAANLSDLRNLVHDLYLYQNDHNTSSEAVEEDSIENEESFEAFTAVDVMQKHQKDDMLTTIALVGKDFFLSQIFRTNNVNLLQRKLGELQLPVQYDITPDTPLRLFEALGRELKEKPANIRTKVINLAMANQDMFKVSIFV